MTYFNFDIPNPTTGSDESTIQVGDFISVPRWKTFGMVTVIEPAQYGPEGTIRVALQEDPNSDRVRWFNLPPGTYEVEQ